MKKSTKRNYFEVSENSEKNVHAIWHRWLSVYVTIQLLQYKIIFCKNTTFSMVIKLQFIKILDML